MSKFRSTLSLLQAMSHRMRLITIEMIFRAYEPCHCCFGKHSSDGI